ncbi:hypothetical protein M8J77_018012 [Diaphorina citri]|nr:hypothetical protein M8J77_018012 [Diaphorina citri]
MSRENEHSVSFTLVTLVTFVLTLTHYAQGYQEANKLDGNGNGNGHIHTIKTRRDSSSGLIAFPRVGRGSDDLTWSAAADLTDPELHEMKRSLMAFPRVGRKPWKRADREGSNNMWFGPRLGRSFGQYKRESEIVPWSFFSIRGLPNLSLRRSSDTAFTPRLGRESNEDTSNYEDNGDDPAYADLAQLSS